MVRSLWSRGARVWDARQLKDASRDLYDELMHGPLAPVQRAASRASRVPY